MEIGYIYKIINKINGKMYIGQTSKTLEQRWREHKHCYKKGKPYPLYRAFNKYGLDNFEMELIEKCKIEELNNREKYWIKFYDTYKNGYNQTLGGEGVRTFNISDKEIIDSYKQLGSIKKVKKKYHCDSKNIIAILKEHNINISSSMDIAKRNGYTVYKMDINDNILESYECLTDAARWIKENLLFNENLDAIRMNLKQKSLKHELYEGFFWKFEYNNNCKRTKTKIYSLDLVKHNKKNIKNLNLKKDNIIKSLNLTKDYKIKSLDLKKKNIRYCSICGNIISKSAKNICQDCYKKQQAKNIPPRKELKQLIRSTPFVHIGKEFGVSDTAVVKWCKKYNLPHKVSEIKKYSDEEWNLL